MIKEETTVIAAAQLPIGEVLKIKKHRLAPEKPQTDKRLAVVTGIHGDELEGQYVCYELARRIRETPELLRGTVDIYPAMNPLGIDCIMRGIPGFDLDMNRIFPGSRTGDMHEYLAAEILRDLAGASLAVDIHASNIYLTEVPQIRINERHKDFLVPIARHANVDFLWVHGASTVLESTFAYQLNSHGVPTLVVEMGVGMRLTRAYGEQLTRGLFSLLRELGIWAGSVPAPREPVVAYDERGTEVCYLNAPCSGIFIKKLPVGSEVAAGDLLGEIVDPLAGQSLARIEAPESGWLFTTREYPVVEEGSLMGRILRESAEHPATEKREPPLEEAAE